jgi:hypothetical protein
MYNVLGQISYPVFVAGVFVFFILASIFSFIVGVGLATRSTTMLRFFVFMNKEYSTRRAIKPLVAPYYIEPVVFKHPTRFGVVITLGALISIVFLAGIDAVVFQPVYFDTFEMQTAEILAGYTKIFLLAGNVGCVLIGLLLLFSPHLLSGLEAYTDAWYTPRRKTRPLYLAHFEVDHWVLAHPTVSGLTLSIMSLGLGVSMYMRL